MRYVIVFSLSLMLAQGAHSAEIETVMEHDKYPHISLDGPLTEGDYEKVLAAAEGFLDKGWQIQLLVNSEGGSIAEAIKIGTFAREAYAVVKIRGNYIKGGKGILRKCFSACVLIFVGSPNRDHEGDNKYFTKEGDFEYEEVNGEMIAKKVPIIGLHRPYYSKGEYGELSPSAARQAYKKIERLVKVYLRDSGAPDEFTSRMFKSASNELDLLPKKEMMSMFPYKEPFLEEWLIAKCGEIIGRELDDLINLAVTRAMSKDKTIAPKGMSEGYADYLDNKYQGIQKCERSILLDHQKEVLAKFKARAGEKTAPAQ